jgi:murein endopeptidase
MKAEDIIEELQDVARQIGVTIRFEKGDFEGGYCVLRDQRLVLINRRLMPTRKASLLALALQNMGLETIFLKPAIRQYIEDEAVKADREAR